MAKLGILIWKNVSLKRRAWLGSLAELILPVFPLLIAAWIVAQWNPDRLPDYPVQDIVHDYNLIASFSTFENIADEDKRICIVSSDSTFYELFPLLSNENVVPARIGSEKLLIDLIRQPSRFLFYTCVIGIVESGSHRNGDYRFTLYTGETSYFGDTTPSHISFTDRESLALPWFYASRGSFLIIDVLRAYVLAKHGAFAFNEEGKFPTQSESSRSFLVSIGTLPMPPVEVLEFYNRFDHVLATIIASLFIVPFLQTSSWIIIEKESKMAELLRTMGASTVDMVLSWLIVQSISVILTSLLAAAVGAVLLSKLVSPSVFLLLYVLASLHYVSGAVLFSSFFSRSRTAQLIGSILFFLSVAFGFFVPIYSEDTVVLGLSMIPGAGFITFLRMIFDFGRFSLRMGTGELTALTPVVAPVSVLFFMACGSIMCCILAVYFHLVLPSEFGAPLPWYFPFTRSFWRGCARACARTCCCGRGRGRGQKDLKGVNGVGSSVSAVVSPVASTPAAAAANNGLSEPLLSPPEQHQSPPPRYDDSSLPPSSASSFLPSSSSSASASASFLLPAPTHPRARVQPPPSMLRGFEAIQIRGLRKEYPARERGRVAAMVKWVTGKCRRKKNNHDEERAADPSERDENQYERMYHDQQHRARQHGQGQGQLEGLELDARSVSGSASVSESESSSDEDHDEDDEGDSEITDDEGGAEGDINHPISDSSSGSNSSSSSSSRRGRSHRGSRRRRNITAVRNLNLDIYQGELFALLGPNGAGKTTTLSVITGLYPPTSGSVRVCGLSLAARAVDGGGGIGVCPQHDVLYSNLTVRDHLELFAQLKGVSSGKDCDVAVEHWAYKLGLDSSGDNKLDFAVSTLSGGQKRKLSVAMAFIGDPQLVILDEPTAGLDFSAQRAVREMLHAERRERAIVLTTHIMEDAEVCDRVAIMAQGSLQCIGSPQFLKKEFGAGYSLIVTKTPLPPGQRDIEKEEDDESEEDEDEDEDEDDVSEFHSTTATTAPPEGSPFSTDPETAALTSNLQTASGRALDALLRPLLPSLRVLSDAAGETRYLVHFDCADSLPNVLEAIDAAPPQMRVMSVAVMVTSLSEVFLKVAADAMVDDDDWTPAPTPVQAHGGQEQEQEQASAAQAGACQASSEGSSNSSSSKDSPSSGASEGASEAATGPIHVADAVSPSSAATAEFAPSPSYSSSQNAPNDAPPNSNNGISYDCSYGYSHGASSVPLANASASASASASAGNSSSNNNNSNAPDPFMRGSDTTYGAGSYEQRRLYGRSLFLGMLGALFMKRARAMTNESPQIRWGLVTPVIMLFLTISASWLVLSAFITGAPFEMGIFHGEHLWDSPIVHGERPEMRTFFARLANVLPAVADGTSLSRIDSRPFTKETFNPCREIADLNPFLLQRVMSMPRAQYRPVSILGCKIQNVPPVEGHTLDAEDGWQQLEQWGDESKDETIVMGFNGTNSYSLGMVPSSNSSSSNGKASRRKRVRSPFGPSGATRYSAEGRAIEEAAERVALWRRQQAQRREEKAQRRAQKALQRAQASNDTRVKRGAPPDSVVVVENNDDDDDEDDDEYVLGDDFVPSRLSIGLLLNTTMPYSFGIAHVTVTNVLLRMAHDEARASGPAPRLTVTHQHVRSSGRPADEKYLYVIVACLGIVLGSINYISTLAHAVVAERVSGAMHLQLISGATRRTYWLGHALWDLALSAVPLLGYAAVLLLFNVLQRVDVTMLSFFICIYFLFIFASIPACYALSFAVERPARAQILIFLTNIASLVFAVIFAVLMSRGITGLSISIPMPFVPAYTLAYALILGSGITDSSAAPSMVFPIICLFFNAILAWTLLYVVQSNRTRSCRRKLSLSSPPSTLVSPTPAELAAPMDDDVARERTEIIYGERENSLHYPIVLNGLRKVYSGANGALPHIALSELYFAVARGQCFGFLGANGAGKSTTMRLLTGATQATAGTATVCGFDIVSDHGAVSASVGYCPQEDAFLPLLTPRDNLRLFARLRGVALADIDTFVTDIMVRVGLTPDADRISETLSGGNKRKLSVALALIGNPPVVILDEPTTGVDPQARRQIWQLINSTMANRSVILTTHSMEECEALASRIGIMIGGRLRCLGSPAHLKSRFGRGFHCSITADEARVDWVVSYVLGSLPGAECTSRHGGALEFSVPSAEGITLAHLFRVLTAGETGGIVSYTARSTDLGEIFSDLVHRHQGRQTLF